MKSFKRAEMILEERLVVDSPMPDETIRTLLRGINEMKRALESIGCFSALYNTKRQKSFRTASFWKTCTHTACAIVLANDTKEAQGVLKKLYGSEGQ